MTRVLTRLVLLLLGLLPLFVLTPTTIATAQEDTWGWRPRISIVWPHDGQGNGTAVGASRAVNVSVWPTTVESCQSGVGVFLGVAWGNEPVSLQPVESGTPFLRTVGGVTFLSGEFNDIAADLVSDPSAQLRFISYGEAAPARATFLGNVWVHAADARTLLPDPVLPTGWVHPSEAPVLDGRIQIVWPHDGQGNPAPVERATHVNVAVEVFQHGTLNQVRSGTGNYPYTVQLYRAEGNEAVELLDKQPELTHYEHNGESYPRWLFNDVPVVPNGQTHFLVYARTGTGRSPSPHSTIWTHAADPRTFLPEPQVPPACAP